MGLYYRRGGPPPDPGQKLFGACGTCRDIIEIERWEARQPSRKMGADADWGDVASCACKKCGAKVLLEPKRDG